MSAPAAAPVPPSEIERWLATHAVLQRVDSARGLYELMPSQSNRQLPAVYVPYDARSEAHWSDAAMIADFAARAPAGARRALDVGPGDGWPALPLAAARPELQVVGVDPSPLRARTCARNARRLDVANARFVVGDAAALPFAGATFDYAVASNALEECERPEAAFAELARVLRPGGVLRVAYQRWELRVPEWESVLLWAGRAGGERVLLYTYARRLRDPALERRYTLELPAEGPAAALHEEALLTAAAAPRAYGETLLEGPWTALGLPLLRRLAPLARRCTLVELRRWRTPWLLQALRDAGFAEARGTAHPGELARHVARELLARERMAEVAPVFAAVSSALGIAGGARHGEEMALAIR